MINKRKALLGLIDTACFACVYIAIVLTSLGSSTAIKFNSWGHYFIHFALLLLINIAVRFCFKIYSNVWRYANSGAYLDMVASDVISAVISVSVTWIAQSSIDMYMGVWQTVLVFTLYSLLTLANRFIYQQTRNQKVKAFDENKINGAIVGAGGVGTLLAQELSANKRSHYKPYCFIDTDPAKIGNSINGLRVYPENLETIDKIKSLPIQEIVLALPKMSGDKTKELLELYSRTDCKIKIYDVPVTVDGDSEGKKTLREIHVEDLLFRNSLVFTGDETKNFYSGKTVMVTGGGGSIGSELCRQIAKCAPKKLIILDIYENNAYDIQQELLRKYGESLDLSVEIASVRDPERLECVFANYRVALVFGFNVFYGTIKEKVNLIF